jgi:hypothetical protein
MEKEKNMKTIGSIKDLLDLQCEFAMHILLTCPWLAEPWNAEDIGYVFIIDDNDIGKVTSVYTAPHLEDEDQSYKKLMTIDLDTFDLWETPATYDDSTGYWNVTAIFGAEYGCTIFLSSNFVASLLGLQEILNDIKQVSCRT